MQKKQFRIVFGTGNSQVKSAWLNADEWTLADMEQFKEIPNYYIEYRG